jgi:hypothetical protein
MLILVAPCLLVGQKQTIVIFLCEKENIDLHWVGFFFFFATKINSGFPCIV